MIYSDVCREAAALIEATCAPFSAVTSNVAHLRALAALLDKIERSQVDEVWGNGHVNCSDTLYALIDPLSDP